MDSYHQGVALIYNTYAEGYELNEDELAQFDDLCEQKIKIVEERDELVNQTEEERLRYLKQYSF